jgi:hypothetical protein
MVTQKKSRTTPARSGAKKSASSPAKEDQARTDSKVQGEGDYESARKFDKDERDFVESHDTEELAREAAPKDAAEEAALDEAERKGKAHARPDPSANDEDGGDIDPREDGGQGHA